MGFVSTWERRGISHADPSNHVRITWGRRGGGGGVLGHPSRPFRPLPGAPRPISGGEIRGFFTCHRGGVFGAKPRFQKPGFFFGVFIRTYFVGKSSRNWVYNYGLRAKSEIFYNKRLTSICTSSVLGSEGSALGPPLVPGEVWYRRYGAAKASTFPVRSLHALGGASGS